MPGQDELPQTFETSSGLVARSDLNALRPRLTVPQPVSLGSRELFIAGIATGFVRGDRMLIVSGPRYHQDDDGNPLPGNPPPGVDVSLLDVLEVDARAGARAHAPEAGGRYRSCRRARSPPEPTTDQPEPPIDFTPPKAPPQPTGEAAELDPPVFVLVPRPSDGG